jgi:hypothetical protein
MRVWGNMPSMSVHAYSWHIEGIGESHRERSLQKVKCELCGVEVNQQQMRPTCSTGQKDYQATLLNHVAEMSRDPPESIEVEEPVSQYCINMDGVTEMTNCLVANFPFGAVLLFGGMRKHF